MRRVNYIDDLVRDLRYAGRSLRLSPGFTTLTVLIMALGIGGNTAVFSLVNQILLHPPGVSEPQRIVVVRALVLPVAAGLFLRNFARLQTVNPGFDPRGVVTAAYSLPPAFANPVKQAAFAWNVLDQLQGAKGVTAASLGRPIPFSSDLEGAAFMIEGRSAPAGEAMPVGERRWVTPDYLRTLGIRLERGRFFDNSDRLGLRYA